MTCDPVAQCVIETDPTLLADVLVSEARIRAAMGVRLLRYSCPREAAVMFELAARYAKEACG